MADLTLAQIMAMTPAQQAAYGKTAMSNAATANNTALNSLIGGGNLSVADTSRLMQGYGLPNANVVNFTDEKGEAARGLSMPGGGGTAASNNMTGNVLPEAGKNYVLIDATTGKVVSQGTGAAGLAAAKTAADALTQAGGKKANWTVVAGTPGDVNSYTPVAQNMPPPDAGLGPLKIIAPVVGAALGSAIPGLGTGIGAGLGAALAAGGVSALNGDDIKHILINAGISGATTFAGANVLSGLSGANSAIPSSVPTQGFSPQFLAAEKGLDTAINAPLTAGLSSLPDLGGNIVVNGALQHAATAVAPAVGAGVGGGAAGALAPFVVQATKAPVQTPAKPAVALPLPDPYAEPVVTGSKPPPSKIDAPEVPLAFPTAPGTISLPSTSDIPKSPDLPKDNTKTTGLSDALKYAKLATLLLGGLGAATSKNGSSVPYTGGASGGNLDPIMHAALPTASIPGLTAETSGARTMPAQDWNLYGMRPGQSFFNNVPSTYTPPAPGQYDAYDKQRPGYQQGFADGGEVHQRLDMTPPRGPDPSPLEAVQLALHYMRGERPSLDVDAPLLGGHFGLGVDVGPEPHMRASYRHAFAGGGPLAFVGDQGPPAPPAGRGPLSHTSDQPIIARGPGGGRGDKIPSLLSDGEYVMDAETVALLGNGSIREGTQKLNDLRVNIRKQKGPAFVKGKLSPDARPAAHYMGAQ